MESRSGQMDSTVLQVGLVEKKTIFFFSLLLLPDQWDGFLSLPSPAFPCVLSLFV